MFSPQAQPPQPKLPTENAGALPVSTPTENSPEPAPLDIQGNDAPTPEEIAAHFDSMPDEAKSFLAEHMTPEFVKAIGLIAGQEVAKYLEPMADPSKLLVPVPRQIAEEYLNQQKSDPQGAPAEQTPGAPAPAPVAPPQVPAPQLPQGAPPQGMMAPKV